MKMHDYIPSYYSALTGNRTRTFDTLSDPRIAKSKYGFPCFVQNNVYLPSMYQWLVILHVMNNKGSGTKSLVFIPIGSMGLVYIYLHEWLVFYGFHVGKIYQATMGSYGIWFESHTPSGDHRKAKSRMQSGVTRDAMLGGVVGNQQFFCLEKTRKSTGSMEA